MSLFDPIKNALKQASDSASELAVDALAAGKSAANSVGEGLKSASVSAGKLADEALVIGKAALETTVDATQSVAEDAFALGKSAANTVGESVKSASVSVGEFAGEALVMGKSALEKTVDVTQNLAGDLLDAGKIAATGVAETAKDAYSNSGEIITELAEGDFKGALGKMSETMKGLGSDVIDTAKHTAQAFAKKEPANNTIIDIDEKDAPENTPKG